jgi:hypothetical protein
MIYLDELVSTDGQRVDAQVRLTERHAQRSEPLGTFA